MSLWRTVRSMGTAMRAGAAVGRCSRSRREGNLPAALAQARAGLELLGKRHVYRENPPEAAALVSLTGLAEEIGSELNEAGASLEDLVDSVRLLNAMNREPVPDLCSSIPFLEARLAVARARPAENRHP
jgi:hypothetical protein